LLFAKKPFRKVPISAKTPAELGRIRGQRPEMQNVSAGCPGHIVTDGCGHASWREKREVVNHGCIFHVQFCSQALDLQSVVGNLDDPKQARLLNTTVEVMQLNAKARTGLIEVNSNEDESTPVMGTVHGNVLALEQAHVVAHIIGVSFAIRRSAYRIG
jgi:hypothetical protein